VARLPERIVRKPFLRHLVEALPPRRQLVRQLVICQWGIRWGSGPRKARTLRPVNAVSYIESQMLRCSPQRKGVGASGKGHRESVGASVKVSVEVSVEVPVEVSDGIGAKRDAPALLAATTRRPRWNWRRGWRRPAARVIHNIIEGRVNMIGYTFL
jgi:hypothetical protein